MNSKNNDPLIDQLRHQARHFDPAPPAGLRRNVLDAVSLADAASSRHRPHALRWSMAGSLAVMALIAIVWFRQLPHSLTTQRPNPPAIVQIPHSADVVVVTQLWSRNPLEGEVHHLLASFNDARDTLTTVLPAAVKRPQPTTQSPTRQIRAL